MRSKTKNTSRPLSKEAQIARVRNVLQQKHHHHHHQSQHSSRADMVHHQRAMYHKFIPFRQRIKSIDIDAVRDIGHVNNIWDMSRAVGAQYGGDGAASSFSSSSSSSSTPATGFRGDTSQFHRTKQAREIQQDDADGNFTFFLEAMNRQLASELNSDYKAFYSRVAPLVQSLPELIHHKETIVDTFVVLLEKEEKCLALKSLLALLPILARELRQEIYPLFKDKLFDSLLPLIKPGDAELIELTFQTLAFLFKYLSKYIVNDVSLWFDKYTVLIAHRQWYIRSFAAESFSFLILKLSDKQRERYVKKTLDLLAEEGDDVRLELLHDGTSQLFFEVVKGPLGQFHLKMDRFMKLLLRQISARTSKVTMEEVHQRRFLLVQKCVLLMGKHARDKASALPLWKLLQDEVISLSDGVVSAAEIGKYQLLQLAHLIGLVKQLTTLSSKTDEQILANIVHRLTSDKLLRVAISHGSEQLFETILSLIETVVNAHKKSSPFLHQHLSAVVKRLTNAAIGKNISVSVVVHLFSFFANIIRSALSFFVGVDERESEKDHSTLLEIFSFVKRILHLQQPSKDSAYMVNVLAFLTSLTHEFDKVDFATDIFSPGTSRVNVENIPDIVNSCFNMLLQQFGLLEQTDHIMLMKWLTVQRNADLDYDIMDESDDGDDGDRNDINRETLNGFNLSACWSCLRVLQRYDPFITEGCETQNHQRFNSMMRALRQQFSLFREWITQSVASTQSPTHDTADITFQCPINIETASLIGEISDTIAALWQVQIETPDMFNARSDIRRSIVQFMSELAEVVRIVPNHVGLLSSMQTLADICNTIEDRADDDNGDESNDRPIPVRIFNLIRPTISVGLSHMNSAIRLNCLEILTRTQFCDNTSNGESADFDVFKPINWLRDAEQCGLEWDRHRQKLYNIQQAFEYIESKRSFITEENAFVIDLVAHYVFGGLFTKLSVYWPKVQALSSSIMDIHFERFWEILYPRILHFHRVDSQERKKKAGRSMIYTNDEEVPIKVLKFAEYRELLSIQPLSSTDELFQDTSSMHAQQKFSFTDYRTYFNMIWDFFTKCRFGKKCKAKLSIEDSNAMTDGLIRLFFQMHELDLEPFIVQTESLRVYHLPKSQKSTKDSMQGRAIILLQFLANCTFSHLDDTTWEQIRSHMDDMLVTTTKGLQGAALSCIKSLLESHPDHEMNEWLLPYLPLVRNVIGFQKQQDLTLPSVPQEHRDELISLIIRILVPNMIISPLQQKVKRNAIRRVEKQWKQLIKQLLYFFSTLEERHLGQVIQFVFEGVDMRNLRSMKLSAVHRVLNILEQISQLIGERGGDVYRPFLDNLLEHVLLPTLDVTKEFDRFYHIQEAKAAARQQESNMDIDESEDASDERSAESGSDESDDNASVSSYDSEDDHDDEGSDFDSISIASEMEGGVMEIESLSDVSDDESDDETHVESAIDDDIFMDGEDGDEKDDDDDDDDDDGDDDEMRMLKPRSLSKVHLFSIKILRKFFKYHPHYEFKKPFLDGLVSIWHYCVQRLRQMAPILEENQPKMRPRMYDYFVQWITQSVETAKRSHSLEFMLLFPRNDEILPTLLDLLGDEQFPVVHSLVLHLMTVLIHLCNRKDMSIDNIHHPTLITCIEDVEQLEQLKDSTIGQAILAPVTNKAVVTLHRIVQHSQRIATRHNKKIMLIMDHLSAYFDDESPADIILQFYGNQFRQVASHRRRLAHVFLLFDRYLPRASDDTKEQYVHIFSKMLLNPRFDEEIKARVLNLINSIGMIREHDMTRSAKVLFMMNAIEQGDDGRLVHRSHLDESAVHLKLGYFDKLAQMSLAEFESYTDLQMLPIMSNLLAMVMHKEFTVREASTRVLCNMISLIDKARNVDADHKRHHYHFTRRVLAREIVAHFSKSPAVTREANSFATLVAELVQHMSEFQDLLVLGDEFFKSMASNQLQKKLSALSQLSTLCAEGKFVPSQARNLFHLFVPLCYRFMQDAKNESRKAGFNTLLALVDCLEWQHVKSIFFHVFRMIGAEKAQEAREGTEETHFDQLIANVDMLVNHVLNRLSSGKHGSNLHRQSNDVVFGVPRDHVKQFMLKTVASKLKSHMWDKQENIDNLYMPTTLVLIKILKALDSKHALSALANKIVLHLINKLRSKFDYQRSLARKTLISVLRELGDGFLYMTLTQLKSSLVDGYQQHVLQVTVLDILTMIKQTPKFGITSCLTVLIDLLLDGIKVSDVKEMIRDMREKHMTQNFGTVYQCMEIVGQVINLRDSGNLGTILSSMDRRMSNVHNREVLDRFDSVFVRLDQGLRMNRVFPEVTVTRLIHEWMLKKSLYHRSFDHIESAQAQERSDLIAIRERDLQHRKRFLFEKEPGRLGAYDADDPRALKVAVGEGDNDHVIVRFLVSLLQKTFLKKVDNSGQMSKKPVLTSSWCKLLDSIVPLLVKYMTEKNLELALASLTTLVAMYKFIQQDQQRGDELVVPSLEHSTQNIVNAMFELILNSGVEASKTWSVVFEALRHFVSSHSTKITEHQLDILLDMLKLEFSSRKSKHTNQHEPYALLKLLIDKEIISPQIYDMIIKVRSKMLSTTDATVRDYCIDCLAKFYIYYPMTGEVLQEHLNFLLKNLLNDHLQPTSKISLLQMIKTVVDKFPSEFLDQKVEVFVLPVTTQYVNEPDPGRSSSSSVAFSVDQPESRKIKNLLFDILATLLRKLGNDAFDKVMNYVGKWIKSDDEKLEKAGSALFHVASCISNGRKIKRHMDSLATHVLQYVKLCCDPDYFATLADMEEVHNSILLSYLRALERLFEFKVDPIDISKTKSRFAKMFRKQFLLLLTHPDVLVRQAVIALFELYMKRSKSKWNKVAVEGSEEGEFVKKFSHVLVQNIMSRNLTPEMGDSIVRLLLVIVKRLLNAQDELGEQPQSQEKEHPLQQIFDNLHRASVFKYSKKLMKQQMIPDEATAHRITCARQLTTMKLFLAIAVECKERIVRFLPSMVPVLVEVLEEQQRRQGKGTAGSAMQTQQQQLREFAEESKQLIMEHTDVQEFLLAYDAAKSYIQQQVEESNASSVQLAITNPMQYQQAKHKERKQKSKEKKRRRKEEREDDGETRSASKRVKKTPRGDAGAQVSRRLDANVKRDMKRRKLK